MGNGHMIIYHVISKMCHELQVVINYSIVYISLISKLSTIMYDESNSNDIINVY